MRVLGIFSLITSFALQGSLSFLQGFVVLQIETKVSLYMLAKLKCTVMTFGLRGVAFQVSPSLYKLVYSVSNLDLLARNEKASLEVRSYTDT